MPPNISWFDYLVPENLEKIISAGQLVQVPFRNGLEYGLVYSLDQKTVLNEQTKLRTLESICLPTSFIPTPIFKFFGEIAEFYATDLGFIYKFSFPKFTKKFFNGLDASDFPESVEFSTISKPKTVIVQNLPEVGNYLFENLSSAGQHLILVPEKSDLQEVALLLDGKFNIEILSSDITDKNETALWKKIRKNENIVVIGTRKALFLPWVDLKNIILLDEGNENYKSSDMAPRYHTRDAGMLLSKFTKAQISLVSHTPSVNSYYFAKEKKYDLKGELKNFNRSLVNVDLNLEKHARNYSSLSFRLIDELKNLQPGYSSFLYLNKKGSAGYVFCKDCQKPVTCPQCNRSLDYFASKKEMRCNYCEIALPLSSHCPNCQSLNLQMRNPGTESVEKDLLKLPELKNFQIVRIDSENQLDKNLYQDGENTIFIGTELAWGLIPWKKIKLVAFLDTDRSLLSSEYKNLENLWQKIRESFFKSNSDCKIILQSSHLDHYLFSALNSPSEFYEQQLKERFLFQYPPFNFWLKLAISDKNANIAVRGANELKIRLLALTNTLKNANISGPHQAIPYLHKGAYTYILLVRLGYENYQSAVKQINKLMPKNWKVDPNPNTLLNF